jgi:hypothetical protein
VDNFMLLDQHGKAHELYYHADAEAVVIMIQGNGCPIVRNAVTDYQSLATEYADDGVRFFMLNGNLQDKRDSIAAEAREYGIELPVLVDDTQLVSEALGVVRTAEVFVIDPDTWDLVYRGPLNDRVTYEHQKPAPDHTYLADTLDALLAGNAVPAAQRDAVGCLINFPAANEEHEVAYRGGLHGAARDRCSCAHAHGCSLDSSGRRCHHRRLQSFWRERNHGLHDGDGRTLCDGACTYVRSLDRDS